MSVVAVVGEGLMEIGFDVDTDEDTFRRGYGGDAPNAAVMAALAGASARICGRVGDDAFGRLLVSFWSRRGVDTRSVITDIDAPTGVYVNEATPDGHHFRYYRSGSAGSRLQPDDVTPALLDRVGVLYFTGVTLAISPNAATAARSAAERARAGGARVAFAVNYRPALAPDEDALLAAARAADIVFVSHDEAEALLGVREPEAIAGALAIDGANELVVTSAARGAAVRANGSWQSVEAPIVDVADAAGAGDALAGCYLAERLRGSAPPEALRIAVAAASLSCTRRGCAASYPDRAELDAFV